MCQDSCSKQGTYLLDTVSSIHHQYSSMDAFPTIATAAPVAAEENGTPIDYETGGGGSSSGPTCTIA